MRYHEIIEIVPLDRQKAKLRFQQLTAAKPKLAYTQARRDNRMQLSQRKSAQLFNKAKPRISRVQGFQQENHSNDIFSKHAHRAYCTLPIAASAFSANP
jgi:hypothetical protein